jgi:hypothetical protein
MHQHKIVAQILLILTILNSVLAAPILRVREMPEARGAVAVRAPAEGVVAVLVKRPSEEPPESVGSSPGPQLTAASGHPQQPATDPEETYHDASSEDLGPPEPNRPVSSNAAWRQKIMTPEKIKATKYAAAVALLTTAYLSLLVPEIDHGNSQS